MNDPLHVATKMSFGLQLTSVLFALSCAILSAALVNAAWRKKPEPLTTEWASDLSVARIELGFRADGVVVWREIKK